MKNVYRCYWKVSRPWFESTCYQWNRPFNGNPKFFFMIKIGNVKFTFSVE